MKTVTFKISLLAFITAAFVSCNNNTTKSEEVLEDVAEASETAHSYTVDTDGSVIKWEGKKPGTTHYGHVKLSSGTLLVENNQLVAGNFTIDMTSIVVEDLEGEYKENLEAHLKGTAEGKEGDFFDTNKYPTGTFELTRVEGNTVRGNLTIKEETKTVEFPATINITDDQITIRTEQFDLDRTRWGINFMSRSIFSNLGDNFIDDTMKITLHIVANK